MQLSGPYNSPLALGVRPWGSLFFSFWAVFVFSTAMQEFLVFIAPEFMQAVSAGETPDALQAGWTVILIGYAVTLFLTMSWAEYIGAGPFAAAMKTEPDWMLIGLAGGPMILIVGNVIAAMAFSGGDPNWHLQDGVDTKAMSAEATSGIAFAFTVVFLAPVLEEIAYRGIGLGCLLARGWPPLLAAAIVTLLFTLAHMHLSPPAMLPVFAAGAFFAWLRIRSGSLAPCIAGHMAANTAILFL